MKLVESTAVLTGLPPLVSSRTRLLVLGSFPGVASLASQQYYGHPRNHFWQILQAIWPSIPIGTGASSYQIRSELLLDRQLGLWDVYAACERVGSLDSRIRHPVVNDFAALKLRCPALEAIVHNGGESFRHSKHVNEALARTGAELCFYQLPSTSPANASWRFERKLTAWRDVFEQHGLI